MTDEDREAALQELRDWFNAGFPPHKLFAPEPEERGGE